MNPIEKVVRSVDRYQQRHTVPAVAFAVTKKYGDDAAGNLATVLSFSGFLTIFPLLLLLVTIAGLVLSGDPALHKRVLDSAYGQFPIVGIELKKNVHELQRNSIIGLGAAVLFLLYGSLGLAQNGIYAMVQIWNVPGVIRPNFVKRLGRSMEFLGVLALGVAITTFLSGVGTNTASRPLAVDVAAVAGSAIVGFGQFLLAYRVLTPPVIKTRWLLPGAIVSGGGWTILQVVGTFLVGHTLSNQTAVYGIFAIVLGLIFWISLVSRLVVYSTELNVVLERRLWPRSIVQPPLTRADREVLAAQAMQNLRRPEQNVTVTFDADPEGDSDVEDGGGGGDGGNGGNGGDDGNDDSSPAEPTRRAPTEQ